MKRELRKQAIDLLEHINTQQQKFDDMLTELDDMHQSVFALLKPPEKKP